MKYRLGFVSNSSSCSFLIYGTVVEREKVSNLVELISKENLDITYYNDYAYIGKSWDKIKDDETGAQFKEPIKKALVRIFGDNVVVETLEEAWYDG
jgi:hypothetical protein